MCYVFFVNEMNYLHKIYLIIMKLLPFLFEIITCNVIHDTAVESETKPQKVLAAQQSLIVLRCYSHTEEISRASTFF